MALGRLQSEASTQSYSSRVTRSFVWQGAATLTGQMISWASTIIVMRLLSKEDYGLIAVAGFYIGILLLLRDLGTGAAAIQAPSLRASELRDLLGFVLVTHGLAAAVAYVGAPAVAALYREPRLEGLVRWMSASFLLIALYALPEALVARDLRFDLKARIDVVATILGAVTALGLAWSGAGVWSLVASVLAIHAVKAAAFNLVRPCRYLPRLSRPWASPALRFGSLITLDRLLWFSYSNLDVAIAGRLLGTGATGVYAVARSLASIPLDKFAPIVSQVMFPAFSAIQEQADRVRRNVMRSFQAVALIAFPTFLGLAAVAKELISLLLGPKWLELVVPFQIICVVLPLNTIGSLLPPALFAVRHARVNVGNMAITLVIMAVAFGIGASFGVVGMACAWALGYPVAFVMTTGRALNVLGIRASEAVEAVRFPLWATGVMTAVLMGCRALLHAHLAPSALLPTLIILGIAVYGGLALRYNRKVLNTLGALSGLQFLRRLSRAL